MGYYFRHEHRKKIKLSQSIRNNVIAEKILWFKERVPQNQDVCIVEQVEYLINK